MTDRVLKRYELQTRQVHLEPLYPGAEIWLGRDTDVGLPATIITYPWAPEHAGSSTARALWSAEVRKLFRLSCQPFDPSLIGFVNGGFDEPTRKLVLVTQDADLPSAQAWLSDGPGKSCATQWRGNHAPNRAELWDHIAGLFGALSSIHESRIVHRRIQPHNILVDEALSRDQPGFLKLGRFEASTFFRIPRLRGRRPPARRRLSGLTSGTPSISEHCQPAARYWVARRPGTSMDCLSPLSGCSAGGREITQISTASSSPAAMTTALRLSASDARLCRRRSSSYSPRRNAASSSRSSHRSLP